MRHHLKALATALALSSAVLFTAPVRAADVFWIGGSPNEFFDVGENWNTGSPPTVTDTAVFNLPGDYDVGWDNITGDNFITDGMRVETGNASFITTDVPHLYQLTGDAIIQAGGTLALDRIIIAMVSNRMTVGSAGDGMLTINAESELDSRSGVIGEAGALGTVVVDGGRWEFSDILTLGESGGGSLTVDTGGLVRGNGLLTADQPTAFATLVIGDNSRVEVNGLRTGAGTTVITVANGGTLKANGIEMDPAGTSTLNLHGGALQVGPLIEVGTFNVANIPGVAASFDLQSGQSLSAGSVFVGNSEPSLGELNVFGDMDTSYLNINATGRVIVDGGSVSGRGANSQIVLVDGFLVVQNGAEIDGIQQITMQTGELFMQPGGGSGTQSELVIDGPGTVVRLNEQSSNSITGLTVGFGGDATATISGGAVLEIGASGMPGFPSGFLVGSEVPEELGGPFPGFSTLTVTGADSVLRVSGDNIQGSVGSPTLANDFLIELGVPIVNTDLPTAGELVIADGGKVILDSFGARTARLIAADTRDSYARLMISGPGSLLDVDGEIQLGVDRDGLFETGEAELFVYERAGVRANVINVGIKSRAAIDDPSTTVEFETALLVLGELDLTAATLSGSGDAAAIQVLGGAFTAAGGAQINGIESLGAQTDFIRGDVLGGRVTITGPGTVVEIVQRTTNSIGGFGVGGGDDSIGVISDGALVDIATDGSLGPWMGLSIGLTVPPEISGDTSFGDGMLTVDNAELRLTGPGIFGSIGSSTALVDRFEPFIPGLQNLPAQGALEILNGGQVVLSSSNDDAAVVVADTEGSVGSIRIAGTGSLLDAGNRLSLGASLAGILMNGTADLLVESGGNLVAANLAIGINATAVIDGDGSSLQTNGIAIAGGNLDVQQTASVGPSGAGTLFVSLSSGAELNVTDGARFDGSQIVTTPDASGEVTRVWIDGSGTEVNLGDPTGAAIQPALLVGWGNTAEAAITNGAALNIDDGGVANNPAGIIVGTNGSPPLFGSVFPGHGTLNVDAPGSEVLVTGERVAVYVGSSTPIAALTGGIGDPAVNTGGNGALNITNGGRLLLQETPGGSAWTVVADTPDAVGSITVYGADAFLDAGQLLILGGSDPTGSVPSAGGGTALVDVTNGGRLLVGAVDAWNATVVITSGGEFVVSAAESTSPAVLNGPGTSRFDVFGGMLSIGGDADIDQLNVLTDGIVNADGLTIRESLLIDGGEVTAARIDAANTLAFVAGTLNITGDLWLADIAPLDTLRAGQTLRVAAQTHLDNGQMLTVDGGEFATGSIVGNGIEFLAGSVELTASGLGIGAAGLFGDVYETSSNRMLTSAGNVVVDPAAILRLAADTLAAPRIVNQGDVQIAGLKVGGQIGVLENAGLVRGNGQIDSVLENTAGGEVRALAGNELRFTGSGNTNAGEINLLGGVVEFTGDLTNAAGGFIGGRGTLAGAGGISNEGTLAFSGTSDILGDIANVGDGRIIVTGGSTLTIFDDLNHTGAEIRVSPGSRIVFLGEFSGSKPLTGGGDFFLEGDLRPGDSPGLLEIGGNATFGSLLLSELEIGGLLRGKEYDAVNIDGELILDGTLNIVLVDIGNGIFSPNEGDTFDLFDAIAISGGFAALNLPDPGNGLAWNTDLLNTQGVISVKAVPLPSAVWLLLTGLISVGGLSRRR